MSGNAQTGPEGPSRANPDAPSGEFERRKLELEYYKARLDYRKFVLGSVFVAISIAAIPPLFQLATAVLEYVKTEQQLRIDQANKEADRQIKQQAFRDDYIKEFLSNAISQDIELRIRFAEYFTHVSTDAYKPDWAAYLKELIEHRKEIRGKIDKLEADWFKLAPRKEENLVEVEQLERNLAWAYKEVGYVERNRSVAINPRSPEAGGPVDGAGGYQARPISYSEEIVKRIRDRPGVPYPSGTTIQKKSSDQSRLGIILHTAESPDAVVALLQKGRPDLPGPLVHWAVLSDGSIAFVADEAQRVSHLGVADKGLTNSNTIGIQATGQAFSDDRQIENLIRLVADVADRWEIPTAMIFSHGEVALPPGRKSDMVQQAPAVRKMVDAVRNLRK
jgi:hypothetical protein